MCAIDLEPCEIWSEKERMARKQHVCSCCRAAIVPGERYTDHFSKFDGEVTSEKMCVLCGEDRASFADVHDGQFTNPSYFPQLLRECISDGDEESKRLWRPMLERIKERSPR